MTNVVKLTFAALVTVGLSFAVMPVQAAQNAQQAAQNAQQATQNAQQATQNAQQATQNAHQTTHNAQHATHNAQQAASKTQVHAAADTEKCYGIAKAGKHEALTVPNGLCNQIIGGSTTPLNKAQMANNPSVGSRK